LYVKSFELQGAFGGLSHINHIALKVGLRWVYESQFREDGFWPLGKPNF